MKMKKRSKMRRTSVTCLIFLLIFVVGCKALCKTGASEIPAVLWERTFSSEDVNEITEWNLKPQDVPSPYKEFGILGYKEEQYRNAGLELKPKKMTVLGNSSNYIIDLEFPVEIHGIVKKYGHNIQFQIRILNGPPPWFDIYTTLKLTQAIVLKNDSSPIVAELDNDIFRSTRCRRCFMACPSIGNDTL